MERLSKGLFKQEFVSSFDGDVSEDLRPRQTPGVLYSKAVPTPVSKPELLAWSDQLGEALGVDKPADEEDVSVLAGNLVTETMFPYAACYAGHQFGNWAGQLGDGRAITLGEWPTPAGSSWELQLKGAGPTPYSRRADGRAVLRSSVREYLMSEAMYYLGVPTTRALGLVATGDPVLRDMFYDGHPAYEPGAIVMRAAPSFLRFGNFELLASRQELDNLRKLTDWTIGRYYPHITGADRLLEWFSEVVQRTARLVVEWMRVGFVHGVMNTDNMSVLGLTIDYGPYSFVDAYDPMFTPNTTDLPGRRYAFGRQPAVAKWNLGCFASAIAPLFDDTDALVAVLDSYDEMFWKQYCAMMAGKLGLDEVRPGDADLITAAEKMLITLKPDMTIFYQRLITLPDVGKDEDSIVGHFSDSFYNTPDKDAVSLLTSFIDRYLQRREANACTENETIEKMKKSNPRFILRNYLLHQAIQDLEKGDHSLFDQLGMAMREPYSDKFDKFFAKRPDWAGNQAGCSMLSCSS